MAGLKIYVASSWRNNSQHLVVKALRGDGHEVYDFRNPKPGEHGFSWSAADPGLKDNGPRYFAAKLDSNPIAMAGFRNDRDALHWCDVCVMVLPCGRSAHLEAGYAAGQGKKVLFLLSEHQWEPELMYLLGDGFCLSVLDTLIACRQIAARGDRLNWSTIGFADTGADTRSALEIPSFLQRMATNSEENGDG